MEEVQKFLQKVGSQAVTEALNSTVISRNDIRRVKSVRFSSFPFCGTQWFFNLPKLLSKQTARDFGFGYFTGVGTTVHSVIQEALHRSLGVSNIKVYWDWKCRSCGHMHSLLFISPEACESCGHKELSREEHEIVYKGALGHVDTILSFDLPASMQDNLGHERGSMVIDYKTCTLQATTTPGKLPYAHNVAQISKYTAVLRANKNIDPMLGWGLVYLPRDVPFRYKVHTSYMSPKECKEARKEIVGFVQDHKAWATVSELSDILGMVSKRPCTSKLAPAEHHDCEYRSTCISGKASQHAAIVFAKVKTKLPILKG